MKNIVIAVVVLAVAIVALGFWRGWFETGGKKDTENIQANLKVNLGKFKEDKDHFKKLLADKSKSMKEKLASLNDKVKNLSGDAKAKAEKEIQALTQKHETIDAKMKDVDESTEEKLESLKKSLAGDLGAGTEDGKEEGAGAPK
jgi:hypothetical protein